MEAAGEEAAGEEAGEEAAVVPMTEEEAAGEEAGEEAAVVPMTEEEAAGEETAGEETAGEEAAGEEAAGEEATVVPMMEEAADEPGTSVAVTGQMVVETAILYNLLDKIQNVANILNLHDSSQSS